MNTMSERLSSALTSLDSSSMNAILKGTKRPMYNKNMMITTDHNCLNWESGWMYALHFLRCFNFSKSSNSLLAAFLTLNEPSF